MEDRQRPEHQEDHAGHGARGHPRGQGAATGQRSPSVRRAHHPGDPGPVGGRRRVDHPLLRPVDAVEKVGVVVLAADRAWPAPTTRRSSRPPSERSRPLVPRATEYALVTVGRKPRRTSASGTTRSRRAFEGFSWRTRPSRDAVAVAARVRDLFGTAVVTASTWCTPGSSRSGPRDWSFPAASCPRGRRHHRRGRRRLGHRRLRVPAVGHRGPRDPARALPRRSGLRRPARRRGVGARRTASGP